MIFSPLGLRLKFESCNGECVAALESEFDLYF